MSPNVMEMGRAQCLLEHAAAGGSDTTLQDTEAGEREEVTGVDGGGEHLVTAQGVGLRALTPQHLAWSSRHSARRGGRGSQARTNALPISG